MMKAFIESRGRQAYRWKESPGNFDFNQEIFTRRFGKSLP
jgi:hypothetical protein